MLNSKSLSKRRKWTDEVCIFLCVAVDFVLGSFGQGDSHEVCAPIFGLLPGLSWFQDNFKLEMAICISFEDLAFSLQGLHAKVFARAKAVGSIIVPAAGVNATHEIDLVKMGPLATLNFPSTFNSDDLEGQGISITCVGSTGYRTPPPFPPSLGASPPSPPGAISVGGGLVINDQTVSTSVVDATSAMSSFMSLSDSASPTSACPMPCHRIPSGGISLCDFQCSLCTQCMNYRQEEAQTQQALVGQFREVEQARSAATGLIIGVLVFVCAFVGGTIWCLRRQKRMRLLRRGLLQNEQAGRLPLPGAVNGGEMSMGTLVAGNTGENNLRSHNI